MSKILVFDLGTTYFKVCLFNETGRLIGLRRVATPVDHLDEGRTELPVSSFRQTLTRTILEAVASELHRQVDVLCRQSQPEVVRSVGGAARSKLWSKIKSEHLGCRVQAMDCLEPTSLGVAILAQHARSKVTTLLDLAQEWCTPSYCA